MEIEPRFLGSVKVQVFLLPRRNQEVLLVRKSHKRDARSRPNAVQLVE
jgi:hypothetical protein